MHVCVHYYSDLSTALSKCLSRAPFALVRKGLYQVFSLSCVPLP